MPAPPAARRGRVKIEAPAKINLYLEVTGKRADGYHTLETLFARISLKDDLVLEPAGEPSLKVVHRGPTRVPQGPDNLVLRAQNAFRVRFGGPAARIRLTKRVPSGAGLGGGSSDAAAVLRALARWTPAPAAELRRLAAKLGADVPFFLEEAPLALGRGIGERLRPVAAPRPPWAVIVFPKVGVSTAEAFRRLRPPGDSSLTNKPFLDKILRGLKAGAPPSAWDRCLFNRLEEPVFELCPETLQAKRFFEAAGARALLSGSGSCVFALAPGAAAARRLAGIVRKKGPAGWKVYAVRLLG